MPRDHTRVNIDIWGDDEFRDLPVDAQNLYWRLWTSPERTYCGSHEWRPAKLVQSAGDWTMPRILAAAAILSERLFLIIDTDTEECLLRSWIKHDGLWKTPNMAVSMANARAALGSKTLRGVIVHEVKKLVEAEPKQGGWTRDEVKKMLAQNAIDPAEIEPFNPDPNGGIDPHVNPPLNPPVNPYGHNGVNPPVNPPPTTATPTPTATTGGYVGSESHQSGAPTTPRPHCSRHKENAPGPCPECRQRREWDEAQAATAAADEFNRKRQLRALRDNCPRCKGTNLIETGPNSAMKCDHKAVSNA